MTQVFVSYRKADFANASRIVEALRNAGIPVWWDESLTPRVSWDSMIEREIAEAFAVVVLWTPASIESDWVRTEAHYAQDRGKLIPVMLEKCTPPLAFLLKQTIDLTNWNGDASDRMWKKLLSWISDISSTKLGEANLPRAMSRAPIENPFQEIVGHLPTGEAIVDGAFITANTPASTVFRDNPCSPILRIVPPGSFMIGSPPDETGRMNVEGPRKRVEINNPIAFGIYPVLRCEYLSKFHKDEYCAEDKVPIVNVSYVDALEYLSALTAATGQEYRLPSESEWEYACRAGSRGQYNLGDMIDPSRAVYECESGPLPVGDRPPNAFGLYDMHGNVREWTQDLWHESYESLPQDGAAAVDGHGSMRVVRGGGWKDSALLLRSAARLRATQFSSSEVIGFRVVRVLG